MKRNFNFYFFNNKASAPEHLLSKQCLTFRVERKIERKEERKLFDEWKKMEKIK